MRSSNNRRIKAYHKQTTLETITKRQTKTTKTKYNFFSAPRRRRLSASKPQN